MGSKRQATSDLNHDNWDAVETSEERGTFRAASEDELKSRVIKKARRKLPETTDKSSNAPKSVFSGFAGFGKVGSSTGSSTSTFSFLSKIPEAATVSSANVAASKPNFSFTSLDSQSNKTNTSAAGKDSDENAVNKSKEYCTKLIDLNRAFSDWIKTCIDKDPLCYLTPVFKNYDDYLKQLDQQEQARSKTTTATISSSSSMFSMTTTAATTNTTTSVSDTKPAAVFSFGSGSAFGSTSDNQGGTKSIFGGFGTAASTSAAASSSSSSTKPPNGLSFGTDAGKATSSNFSFTSSTTPFSFGNIKPPAASANTEEEDEEDQPPKVEFKQVLEADAVYSKKCKVFVKKEDNFADRGVGTLYLKPVQNGEKTQLLVRADTNLGNILVNFMLNAAIPAQRMGKNNVVMVCIPTPEEEKAVSLLLRVKTAEEADDLLAAINKYKK